MSNSEMYSEILKAIRIKLDNFIVDLPNNIKETNISLYLSINKFLLNLEKIGLDMGDIRERFIINNSVLLYTYHSFPKKCDDELVSEPTKFMKGLQNKISDMFYEHYKKNKVMKNEFKMIFFKISKTRVCIFGSSLPIC